MASLALPPGFLWRASNSHLVKDGRRHRPYPVAGDGGAELWRRALLARGGGSEKATPLPLTRIGDGVCPRVLLDHLPVAPGGKSAELATAATPISSSEYGEPGTTTQDRRWTSEEDIWQE